MQIKKIIFILIITLSFSNIKSEIVSSSTYNLCLDDNPFNFNIVNLISSPESRTNIKSSGDVLISDSGVDWYGEVSSKSFINTKDLIDFVGLKEGIVLNEESNWLHVGFYDREFYISKKPLINNISWNQLNDAGLIWGQKIITINDNQYRIRVPSCSIYPSNKKLEEFDSRLAYRSEWNHIFYRLTNNKNPLNSKWSEFPKLSLASYDEKDLGLLDYLTLCQEVSVKYTIVRGEKGVSYLTVIDREESTPRTTWRPLLEKIN